MHMFVYLENTNLFTRKFNSLIYFSKDVRRLKAKRFLGAFPFDYCNFIIIHFICKASSCLSTALGVPVEPVKLIRERIFEGRKEEIGI